MKNAFSTRKVISAGLLIAIAFLLPYLTGQLGALGQRLAPMHLPVLIAGYVCGAPAALLVGFISPLLRSLITGMPPIYPVAISMALELAAYGFFAGFFYKKLSKNTVNIYVSLLLSMLIGRLVGGLANVILLGASDGTYTFGIFMTGMFINAIPGIIIQIILVPVIVLALKKAKVLDN